MKENKLGTRLSWLLRHCREPVYVDLNDGWASVETMLKVLPATREELNEIVARDNKTRFSFDETGTKIRANQGHSIPGVVVNMEQPEAPEFLYHGTAERFLESILKDGLKPMGRLWVHLSSDYHTAVNVGSRHGSPVVLRVAARKLTEEGYSLFRSDNGVWQAREVPPRFLERLWQQEETQEKG